MSRPFYVADVGNSSIDVAEFELDAEAHEVPSPTRTQKFRVSDLSLEVLREWSRSSEKSDWLIGSVNQPVSAQLESLLTSDFASRVRCVTYRDVDLQLAVRNPETVGIDRLASAMAVNRMRTSTRPAIIIDAGSATTIDVVSNEGTFLGGMITPGIRLSVDSLALGTDGLPNVSTDFRLVVPAMIGNDTPSAIQAGVFWSAVASIDGIVHRLQQELAGECDVFATGGSINALLPHMSRRYSIKHEPNLVVTGLALAK